MDDHLASFNAQPLNTVKNYGGPFPSVGYHGSFREFNHISLTPDRPTLWCSIDPAHARAFALSRAPKDAKFVFVYRIDFDPLPTKVAEFASEDDLKKLSRFSKRENPTDACWRLAEEGRYDGVLYYSCGELFFGGLNATKMRISVEERLHNQPN